jgi:DNA-binding transcriptional MerR regulator
MMEPVADGLLRIGQLAEMTGTSADSIRHYERLGLLPAPGRTEGGYRLFPHAALDRVRLIRGAVRVGFSLRQLATFLQQREAGYAPCRRVRAAAAQILDGVDQQIAELQASRDMLRTMLRQWDAQLAKTPSNQPARLLDSLSASRPRVARASTTHLKRAR